MAMIFEPGKEREREREVEERVEREGLND